MKRFLLIVSLISLVLGACQEEYTPLPKVGNFDLEYRTVNGKEVVDTIYPKMIEFSYLNQDSTVVRSQDMKGKVWVSDFFFTSCPTICPTMTKQMKRLNEELSDLSDDIQFMSFSINPKRDQPTRLRAYMKKYDITANNWQFFTGDEAKTHKLGIENFQLFAGKDAASAGGYAHSPAFTLVDKEGYIRGVYVGVEPTEVDRMAKDIRNLLKHEYGVSGSKK
ncbi:MAG: SCO family protein [Crocinitomicaceae bacterium]